MLRIQIRIRFQVPRRICILYLLVKYTDPQHCFQQNPDPDPNPDPSDPYVFGPPGSGSVSQRYASGSFYHQAKIVRKTLIPTAL